VGVSVASTHIKRGRGGGTMSWPPPLLGCPLLPYKRRVRASPPIHLPHLPSSPPAAPYHGLPLGEALTVGFFTASRCCAAGFPGILYFRCPAGSRERRSSSSCTCDRARRRSAYIIAILRSASEPLHHPRDLIS
jgi:hypothetical protein